MTSDRPPIDPRSPTEAMLNCLRALPEPVLALVAAFLITALLTLPFIPTSLDVEVLLRPDSESDARTTHADLVRRVETLGFGRNVEILPDAEFGRLVIHGVTSREAVELPIGAVLEWGGYERADLDVTKTVNMDALLHGGASRLPWVMTIQAIVFSFGGLALIWFRMQDKTSMPSAGPMRAALLGGAAGLAAVVISGVLSFLLEWIGLPVQEQEWLAELFHDPRTLLKLVPWIVIVGPVSEEIFFRGYVFRFIRQKAGFPAGLLVSSAMFAAIHFNLSGFLIYFAIGCAMGWAYNRTNSLVAPMVGHAAANSIALAVSSLAAGLENQMPGH